MKKKIIASVLVISMAASGIGATSCSAVGGSSLEASQSFSNGSSMCTDMLQYSQSSGQWDQVRTCFNVAPKENIMPSAKPSKLTFRESFNGVCDKNSNKFLCAGKKAKFLLDKGYGGLSKILEEVDKIGKTSKNIWYLAYVVVTLKNGVVSLKNKVLPRRQLHPDKIMANLDEEFLKIKGQEEPKRKIRKAIDGIIAKKQMAKASKTKYKRGDVIYLVGPSGVGKTFSADILARAVMGKHKPLVLSPANVDLVSKQSVISQLFGMQNVYSYYNDKNHKERTSLVQYLRLNPNGVVIINEYDKMHTPGLDEIFRTIMDDGEVNIQGQKIDCSGVTFIITSNESTVSASGANLDETQDDDGTGSRTHIKHDKAFMNRVNLVEFDNLRYEDYMEIARGTFEQIAKNFEKQYGMQINVEGIIENAAKRAEKINQGSRPIVDDMSNGFMQILMAKRREDETNKKCKGKKFIASYDADKDEFSLSELNEVGESVNTTTSSIVFQDELDEQIRKEKALEEAKKSKEEKEKTSEKMGLEDIFASLNIGGATA